MELITLTANRPADRFYQGGPRIAAFRGSDDALDPRQPEDWIGSTTSVHADPRQGITTLPSGIDLPTAIRADPLGWLGQEHLDAYGLDTRLLVKLLDAGQRLPVHAHPDGSFASQHLDRSHGKAEAWCILEGGDVHLGLTRDVGRKELELLTERQRTDELLGLLHTIPVSAGDVVFVPPGVLHAIGAGVFLVELQEPEDLSILLEWDGFELDGQRDGHLGLGFRTALSAVERTARSGVQMQLLVRRDPRAGSLLPPAADRYFRLERSTVAGSAVAEPGFAILLCTAGDLTANDTLLTAGSTLLAPHAAGPIELRGAGEVLMCRPPHPRRRW